MPAPPGPKVGADGARSRRAPGQGDAAEDPRADALQRRRPGDPHRTGARTSGQLLLDGRPLDPCAVLERRRIRAARLRRRAALPAGAIGLMTYSVTDRWAQSARGVLAVTVEGATAAPVAAAPARDAEAEAAAALGKLNNRSATPDRRGRPRRPAARDRRGQGRPGGRGRAGAGARRAAARRPGFDRAPAVRASPISAISPISRRSARKAARTVSCWR